MGCGISTELDLESEQIPHPIHAKKTPSEPGLKVTRSQLEEPLQEYCWSSFRSTYKAYTSVKSFEILNPVQYPMLHMF